MKATDFTRDDCLVGNKRRSYATLEREWRCDGCGGRLGMNWGDEYPDHWYIACRACGGTDFIHEAALRDQEIGATEVLEGLPPELLAAAGYRPEDVGRGTSDVGLLHPEPVEI